MKSPGCYHVAALATALVALTPLRADNDKIAVDVVMDFFPGGEKLPIPTAQKPTYYVPLPFGLESRGGVITDFQKQGKTPEQIEHLIARTLAAQHYLLMTKTGHPTIVLTFKWGYKAPMTAAVGNGMIDPNNPMAGGTGSPYAGGSSQLKSSMQGFVKIDPFFAEMSDLVGGHLVNVGQADGALNFADKDLATMARAPRWYMQITADDFTDWLHHKKTPLWRANISTDLWGHTLDEVIPTMLETAGPLLGKPMKRPQVVSVPVEPPPPGWVTVGRPVVVPTPPSQPETR